MHDAEGGVIDRRGQMLAERLPRTGMAVRVSAHVELPARKAGIRGWLSGAAFMRRTEA